MVKNLKRVVAIALVLTTMLTYLPINWSEVHAATAIAEMVQNNGKSYYYDSGSSNDFDQLIKDLKNKDGQTVTINMLTNWDARENSDFDERLIVPSGCKLTLNMNGWVFDRYNNIDNDWSYNGELICVESGATLTVNGGPKTLHYESVYTSTSRDGKASGVRAFYGGVLTGGASTGGAGGIHVKSDCTVTLNDVTLAGCRAEAPWYDLAGTNSAYGGGIWLTGGNTNLRLNNSTITGCFAYFDGGGIFQSNHNYVNIEMNNSHVDENYAADEGGGIDVDGEYIHISGTNGSTISGNRSATAGGGIYIWNDDTSMSGFKMERNESKNGGAVYTKEATTTLSKLTVKDNKATERGGGIYINNKGNSIASCEIAENRAGVSGAGVYVNENVKDDFNVTGNTKIRDNYGHNLYISDDDPDDSKVAFNLTKGADVHLHYYNTENRDAIMVNKEGDAYKDINCIQFLTADNPGYHFTYNPKPNSRKIYYVKDGKDNVDQYGEVEQKPSDPTRVLYRQANDASHKTADDHSARAGVVGKVNAGGEKSDSGDYDLVRGFYTHEKTDSDTEDTESSFYYSDAFFDDSVDPKIYNEHLATASWVLAFSGTYLRKFDEEDENGNIYYNKHAGARQFMADIGCPDQNIYVNESMQSKPGMDSIGVTIGSKELAKSGDNKTGKILIPVTVRGGGYEAEWASNVTLGKAAAVEGKEAQGFAEAANQVTAEIANYIKVHDLEEERDDGKLVFWVSGFSRAGATANLTAKRLVEKYACDEDGKRNKVFAYPCEAPKGGTDAAEKKDPEKYFCIHNMINAIDIVPLVATTQMGCKRYGVDHYIPGTAKYTYKDDQPSAEQYAYDNVEYFSDGRLREESITISGDHKIKKSVTGVSQGGADGPTQVTTYRDNDIRLQSNFLDGNEAGSVGANEYYKQKMLPQLKAIDSGIVYDNYFHPMTMDFIPPKMKEYGYYKNNHIEFFVLDFVRLLQEGNNSDDWSKAVTSRDYWAEKLQPIMRDTMSLVFSMSGDNSAGFVGRASSIMDKINYVGGEVSMWEIYRNVLGTWHKLSQEDKDKYTTFLLKKLKETGAFDYLSQEDATKLEANWPALADFIFHITDLDYNYHPVGGYHLTTLWGMGDDRPDKERDVKMALVPTFATFSSFILQNHYPEVNIAWTRSYDSYYEGETTEYKVVAMQSASVAKPALMVEDGSGKTKRIEEGKDKTNSVTGDQGLIFDATNIVGEAVYYDVEKTQGTKTDSIAKNKLYRYGDSLEADGDQSSTSYTITAYTMSYDYRSEKAVYNITINNDKHKITVSDLIAEYDQWGKEGDDIKISAGVPKNKYFKNWKASLLDADGNPVEGEDITDDLLGSSKTNVVAAFKMPEVGDPYPNGYRIKLEAVYGDRISEITASPDKPVSGEDLAEKVKVEFNNGAEAKEYPISWSYTYTKDGESPKTVQASGAALDATEYTATVSIPQEQAADIVFGKTVEGISETGSNVIVRRDPSDGSILMSMKMPETEDTEEHPGPATHISITVKAKDLNRPEEDPYDPDTDPIEIAVYKDNEFVLTAPEVSGERFMQWNFKGAESGDDPDVILSEGFSKTDKTIKLKLNENISTTSYEFDAEYIPVISDIEASLDAPEGGKKMPENPVVNVKIANTYEVDPEFVHLTWTPAPVGQDEEKTADYLTAYTATVTVLPKENDEGETYIRAKQIKDEDGNPVDGEYSETSAIFFYSDDLNVTLNGNEAAYDVNASSLSYTFPATTHTLASVTKPADITDVKHGTDAAGITELLPKTTKITTESGASFTAGINWNDPVAPVTDDSRKEMVWTVHGSVVLPDTVADPEDTEKTSFDIKVTVKEAGYIRTPAATLPSGTYLYDQATTIDAATGDGYATYYTLDSSDPEVKEENKYKNGEEILIPRDKAVDGKVVLKIKTVKTDMWDSPVATYVYEFRNDVDVPSAIDPVYNGAQQVGIEASQFYTITSVEGSGASIDEDGNAVATKPGTYKATLKIKDGFTWRIKKSTQDDSEEEYDYPVDDQTVEFKIRGIDLSKVKFAKVKNRTYTGKAIKPALKVTLNGVVLKAGVDYTAVYSSNKKVGIGKAIVIGKGNYAGVSSSFAKFKIVPKKAAIKKAKVGKKKVTLRFKTKVSKTGGSKYQIKYRIKSKGKWKTKTTKKVKYVLKKLKKGKKYQIKVRAFKKVGKVRYYGKWSKTKVTKKVK